MSLNTALSHDADTSVATLSNGVRSVVIRLPHLDSVCVSVFVRTGSRHESRRLNGISHVAEHMAFKGTRERDSHCINLDAERLGADVNAHTDKDHTAYHMRGLARDVAPFLRMLADIVQHSTFPEAELERERQVILQEFLEDEEDALSTAYKLFDQLCFGTHPMAQPVIGTRRNIERFTREELAGYVARQYTAANVVVGIAGNVDPEAVMREVEAAFGAMLQGNENLVDAPTHIGGVKLRRQGDTGQCHVVLGFPIPTLKDDPHAAIVAAALFGEGMSSPLMEQIRERRGLAYYAACSADVTDLSGQFVVEASTTPEHLDEYLTEVATLLLAHAQRIDPIGLERARNQIAVRSLGAQERPFRRLEDATQDLFVHGRVRSRAELTAQIEAVSAGQVRKAFERMLASPVAAAVAGQAGKGAGDRLHAFAAACKG
jgi:predicted Zn-dependent peptidase